MSSLSSSHQYATRRVFQHLGRLLESIAFALDLPVWLLDNEGRTVQHNGPECSACEFLHSFEAGLVGCQDYHRATMIELQTFREPVVKNCYLGLGKILCPLRIENTLIGAVGVFPILMTAYSPDGDSRLDTIIETLGVTRSPELEQTLDRVKVLSPLELQRVVRLLTALSEEIASSSFELTDTVTELISTYDELTLLYRMSQTVGTETAVERICEMILQEVVEMLRPQRAFLLLVDGTRERLVMQRVVGNETQPFERLRVGLGEGLIGQVAVTGEGVIQNHLKGDPVQGLVGSATIGSIVAVPLRTNERILGVVVATDKLSGEDFIANDLKFIAALAGPTSIALENARLNEERIRTERELAWSGIAFAAAHKIGNSLFGLEGYLRRMPELLAEPALDLESLSSAVSRAQHTTNTMKQIIQEFKDFSRADQLKRSPVDLSGLLERLSVPLAEGEGRWKVVKELQPGLPEILADPERLEQIFGELLQNATQAMVDGGTLTLAVARATPEQLDHFEFPLDRKAVCVNIADTGPGIPPENKRHIFDSFFTTRGTGTGLGLAIVRKYVELHGGRIEELGQPGNGADFLVILPVSI